MIASSDHQRRQIEIINQIESQVKNNSLHFSTVSPVRDFKNDPRVCLTSVHIPSYSLKLAINELLVQPLSEISPEHFYYPLESMHITIKNIRVVNDPPHFTKEEIKKAKHVFSSIIPNHFKFKVYFYRLLLFPNNLALMGTTDPELDNIVHDLDKNLKKASIPDDKKYSNTKYFFSNMTLIRFSSTLIPEFKAKIDNLSNKINMEPYTVDSVSLVTCNSVFKKLRIVDSWELR